MRKMSREKGELRICDRCGKEVFCEGIKVAMSMLKQFYEHPREETMRGEE